MSAVPLPGTLICPTVRPGEAIVERDVAMQMKVGTPVVREALIALQGQGFVRRVPNTGTYVTEFDKAFTSVVYKTLNGFASRWLAVTGTPAPVDSHPNQ